MIRKSFKVFRPSLCEKSFTEGRSKNYNGHCIREIRYYEIAADERRIQ